MADADLPDCRNLAEAASRGDEACLEQLLVHYLPRLRAFLRAQVDVSQRLQESVSDLVQSTCRELLQAGAGFEWQGEARFRSWLFTAALNKVRMRLRASNAQKRRHRREDGADLAAVPDAEPTSPSGEAMAQELDALVRRALDALTPDQREVIALARFAALPIGEVAKVMDRSENAVRTLLSRSLVALAAEVDRLQGRPRD